MKAEVFIDERGKQKKRIPELDGIRAIGILLVIGCHYEKFAALGGGILQFGWVGVDIFFALSGYLITNVLLDLRSDDNPLKTFYLRRARRILPPYIIAVTAITIACVAFGDTSVISAQVLLRNAFFLQSFGWFPVILQQLHHPTVALIQTTLPVAPAGIPHGIVSSLGVLWSLSIEEYFYLFWALIVLFFSRRVVMISAIVICCFAFMMRWLGFIGVPSYFTIFHRFDAPIYGSIVALLLSQNRITSRKFWLFIFAGSLSALTAVLIFISPILGFEIRSSHIFMVFGIPAVSIAASSFVALAVQNTGHALLLPLRLAPMRFLGRISYMLYLLHAFIYLLVAQFFFVTWLTTFASLGIAIFLCWLSWKFIESPILNPKKNLPVPKAEPVISSAR